MNIFVTGATGVIGRRAVSLMLAAGHSVTAVGRSLEGLMALKKQGATPRTVDLIDPNAVRRALARHDAIVNLATHVPKPTFLQFLPGAWRQMNRIRTLGSAALVDAAVANGLRLFVQESFAPIYPDSGERWITEEFVPSPAHYNRTVLDAEASANRFTLSGGSSVTLRFAFLYGAGDGFTRKILNSVRRGELPVFGRADGYLSMVNQEDAARAVFAALEAPRGVYNVVDDEPLTRQQFGEAMAGMLGVRPPNLSSQWAAKFAGSVGETLSRSLRISNEKLRGVSGWMPRYRNASEGWRAAMESFPELCRSEKRAVSQEESKVS